LRVRVRVRVRVRAGVASALCDVVLVASC